MKICHKCRTIKELVEFNNWSRSKDGKYHTCKKCRSEYDKNLYKTNSKRRKQISSNNKKYREQLRKKYNNYKKDLICTDCNIQNYIIMEFDHINEKTQNIADMVSSSKPWEYILMEISQCEPVCANCHRIRTHNRKLNKA